jgi:hypothetical protein
MITSVKVEYDWLTPGDKTGMRGVAKEAFLIVIDTFVTTGRNHRTVTLNSVFDFDALAARYSDNFRASTAQTVWDMSEETAKRSRGDLLLNGVRLKDLWQLAIEPWSKNTGRNPLHWVERLDYGGRQVQTDRQVADTLNGRRLRSGTGQPFHRLVIRHIRKAYRIPSLAEHLRNAGRGGSRPSGLGAPFGFRVVVGS